MAKNIKSLLKPVLPKGGASARGRAFTNTFNPDQTDQVLTVPTYRDHLEDIFSERQNRNSQQLIKKLFRQDPDLSATVNAYLTVANTEPRFFVRDLEGKIDRKGHKLLDQVLTALTVRRDYSTRFRFNPTLRTIAENMRFMLLMRGGIATEAIFDKQLVLSQLRHVDMATVEWKEKAPGEYVPEQVPANSSERIDLNQANLFVAFYRRDPTTIYTHSPFVAAINTIAARQQVINDLYRIMQKTGYPRIEAKITEEVLRKNAPADAQADDGQMREWMRARLQEISTQLNRLRPDQAFVHFDSVEVSTMNKEGPKQSMDVTAVIDVLNAQNQAALKTMASVIGRGESGVNTASTEARIFSMNAEELNRPVEENWEQILTFALRMLGYPGYVEVKFDPVELRPWTELEPHRITKQQRLLEQLSLGLISDDEWHVEIHGRIRPDWAPELSGTGFMDQKEAPQADTGSVSPNSDPLGRSVTPSGERSARDNKVNK